MAEVSKIEKPIGGVGCCESRMAERSHWWTDRWLRSSLFLSFSLSLTTYLPTYLSIYLPIYLSTYLSMYLSIYLPIYLCIYLSIYLPIYLSISWSVCLSIYLPVYLQAWKPSYSTRLILFFKVDNIKNAAVLRDFLIFQSWRHQKRRRSNSARLQFFALLTWKYASRHNGCTFSTSQLPKVVRTWCVLYILTWKCASRHNGVHFFDIATSKTGPNVVCFVHFDLEMCFAACDFSSLIWPAGSAPAALASLLFDRPEPQITGKTQCFATFLPFRASASSFFLLFLFYSSFF